MRFCCRWTWLGILAPVVIGAAFLAGCGGGGGSGSESSSESSGSGTSKTSAKVLAIESRGSIKGLVVVKDLDKDDLKDKNKKQKEQIDAYETKEGTKACHESASDKEMGDQTWLLSEDGKGLQAVAVWLAPPSDRYYELTSDDLDPMKGGWEKELKLKQPHCAFTPHVMVVFHQYKDKNGKFKDTDQKITVVNNATTSHNTKIPDIGYDSKLMKADSEAKDHPELKPSKDPYKLNCNVHNWMGGYIWSFDHPFATVTKDDGSFEIKNAPAGTELTLMVWHESMKKPMEKKVTLDKDKMQDAGTIEVEYKK